MLSPCILVNVLYHPIQIHTGFTYDVRRSTCGVVLHRNDRGPRYKVQGLEKLKQGSRSRFGDGGWRMGEGGEETYVLWYTFFKIIF